MSQKSYYGSSYDRYEAHNEESTVHKLKETYWTAKQTVIQKLGKKEDEHLIASDAALDAKLEVFRAIQKSSQDLISVLERYQEKLCLLSNEENSMGRFLKNESQQDKTRAGKMMAAVGKAQSFASQQRLALRVPLVRLHQEVETFWTRAIADTMLTIERMEAARTDYRAALLWMKNVSEMLNPDAYKQLEKFRKVQAQVRKTKLRFDKLKLDSMQKIDLLAASRCNMYSHVLANYQSTLLNFWQKTSSTLSAVAESFKGYQYYEFHLLKDLEEPTKKLAAATTGGPTEGGTAAGSAAADQSDEGLISLDEDPSAQAGSTQRHLSGSLSNLLQPGEGGARAEANRDAIQPFIDFGDDDRDLEEIKRKQDEELDLTGKKMLSAADKKPSKTSAAASADLLSPDFDLEKDDMTLLNEILNMPSAGGDDFSQQWQSSFGSAPPLLPPGGGLMSSPTTESEPADFLPSHLLDLSQLKTGQGQGAGVPSPLAHGQTTSMGMMSLGAMGGAAQHSSAAQPAAGGGGKATAAKAKSKKDQKTDMSAWFNLFADLDPLSNPDAIGRKKDDISDA